MAFATSRRRRPRERRPFQQLPVMFDLEAEWAVGVDDNPTLLDGYPGLNAFQLRLPAAR
jgi:hypothetical protein